MITRKRKIILAAAAVFLIGSGRLLLAAETDTPELSPIEVAAKGLQDNINIVWTCVAAFLVFFMQPGFAMVECGFTRAKNAVNILMKNLMDFSIGSIAFFLVGFGLMFGASNGLFGTTLFGLKGIEPGAHWNWTFLIFQTVFAATAATIVSGAMAERTKFVGYLIYSFFISLFIYPVFGSWAWGAIVLGPRLGKYGPDKKPHAIPGHNIPLAALGVFILWFGWFGFNPGSTTTGNGSIGYIAVTTNLAAATATNLAAATGAIFAMFAAWIIMKKPDASMALNGALAGLVAITCPCDGVSPIAALIIGGVAGILVVLSVLFIDHVLKVDDPVGAVSVHGVNGLWGTLSAGLFNMETGLFYGGGLKQLGVQALGAAAAFAWAFGLGLLLFTIIDKTIGLRVSTEEELKGLDVGEHGMEAYSGFQVFSTT